MIKTDFFRKLAQHGIRPSKLALDAGVWRGTVTKWSRTRIPAERVLDVERITGIPRHELRPDIYPPP